MQRIESGLRIAAGRWSLRLPAERDVERITDLCQDPEIARWTRVPSPYDQEDARRFVSLAGEEAAAGTGAHCCICDEDGLVIGCCGLVDIDWGNLAAEVGYWVGADARRQRVATTAVRAVCRWAFEELGLERLRLQTAVPNAGSNAVARASGFVLEGVARKGWIPGHGGTPGETRVDVNLYGLLPQELVG